MSAALPPRRIPLAVHLLVAHAPHGGDLLRRILELVGVLNMREVGQAVVMLLRDLLTADLDRCTTTRLIEFDVLDLDAQDRCQLLNRRRGVPALELQKQVQVQVLQDLDHRSRHVIPAKLSVVTMQDAVSLFDHETNRFQQRDQVLRDCIGGLTKYIDARRIILRETVRCMCLLQQTDEHGIGRVLPAFRLELLYQHDQGRIRCLTRHDGHPRDDERQGASISRCTPDVPSGVPCATRGS